MSNINYDNSGGRGAELIYVTNLGYVPREKTGGYSPPKSADDSKNVPLPKGGSGASGQPSASSSRSDSGQSGTGTKK